MADRRSIVKWSKQADLNTFRTDTRNMGEELRAAVTEAVHEATQSAVEAMQDAIEDDDQTNYVGLGPYASQGRQDYGGFRENIRGETEEHSTLTKSQWGWLHKREDYYYYQEHGFWYVHTGEDEGSKWIPGVNASYYGAQVAKSVLEQEFKSISDGLGKRKIRSHNYQGRRRPSDPKAG